MEAAQRKILKYWGIIKRKIGLNRTRTGWCRFQITFSVKNKKERKRHKKISFWENLHCPKTPWNFKF